MRLGSSFHDAAHDEISGGMDLMRLLAKNNNKQQQQGGTDWDLSQCCDTYDIVFIVLYVVYHIIIHLLWWRKIGTSYILSPLKILAGKATERCSRNGSPRRRSPRKRWSAS